jgi:hypothetical protein
MTRESEYHQERARTEREWAERAVDQRVGDAHLRLSALHLSRAYMLAEVERALGSAAPVQSWTPGKSAAA